MIDTDISSMDATQLRREIARRFYGKEIVFDRASSAYNAHNIPDWPNDAGAALSLAVELIPTFKDYVQIEDLESGNYSAAYSTQDPDGYISAYPVEYGATLALTLSRLALAALREREV